MSAKTIYIAGPMKDCPDYKTKFDAAETYLEWKGWKVLNPACLPEGLKPETYMPICLAMLNAADAICLLSHYDLSQGAMLEVHYARYQQKDVYEGLESVPIVRDDE